MNYISIDDLSKEIEISAEKSFRELLEKPEQFYYCSLITTGEALPPVVTAWSYEALARHIKENKIPDEDLDFIKWSYGDSPYFDYGSNYFESVRNSFNLRPPMDWNDPAAWKSEFDLRLGAMEGAMARLDKKGIFGAGEKRLALLINVEVMPPDYENTLRAMRLNSKEALAQWLSEAAEPIPKGMNP